MNWRRKFATPVKSSTGKTIRTLADARAFMMAIGRKDPGRLYRNEWHHAWEHLEAAANHGSVADARKAFRNALYLNGMLDFESDRKAR